MAFVSDQVSNGRRFRMLNVVEDYSREMVGELVSVSICGLHVTRFLSHLIEQREKPTKVICDYEQNSSARQTNTERLRETSLR